MHLGNFHKQIEQIGQMKHKKDIQLKTVEKDGHPISPVLDDDKKNYLIDIDGTICDDIPNEEPERMITAQLYPDALKTTNKWFDEGHIITCLLYTSPSPRD